MLHAIKSLTNCLIVLVVLFLASLRWIPFIRLQQACQ